MSNNYSYALNRMLKLDQRLRKDEELHTKYFKFMGYLFGSGHAVTFDEAEAKKYAKIWYHYQSHFCMTTSNKFPVVFDCTAKFKGVYVNDFLHKEPTQYAKMLSQRIDSISYLSLCTNFRYKKLY